MMKLSIVCLALVHLGGCAIVPTADITEEYIRISKPGDILGLVEVQAVTFDSVFSYPIEERELTSYTIVGRNSGRQVRGNSVVTMYFKKKHSKYRWRITPDPFFADYYDADSILLKRDTWYRLTTQNYNFHIYFYIDSKTGESYRKSKPKPGAW